VSRTGKFFGFLLRRGALPGIAADLRWQAVRVNQTDWASTFENIQEREMNAQQRIRKITLKRYSEKGIHK
tara:strand:- start:1550 stop:1759 length:210 start_codon:yes stop_codon:yes gene_type:complete